jgi:hypothetical protein
VKRAETVGNLVTLARAVLWACRTGNNCPSYGSAARKNRAAVNIFTGSQQAPKYGFSSLFFDHLGWHIARTIIST